LGVVATAQALIRVLDANHKCKFKLCATREKDFLVLGDKKISIGCRNRPSHKSQYCAECKVLLSNLQSTKRTVYRQALGLCCVGGWDGVDAQIL